MGKTSAIAAMWKEKRSEKKGKRKERECEAKRRETAAAAVAMRKRESCARPRAGQDEGGAGNGRTKKHWECGKRENNGGDGTRVRGYSERGWIFYSLRIFFFLSSSLLGRAVSQVFSFLMMDFRSSA